MGAADHELARGVDEDFARFFIKKAGGFEHRTDNLALHGLDDVILTGGFGMLDGNNHIV